MNKVLSDQLTATAIPQNTNPSNKSDFGIGDLVPLPMPSHIDLDLTSQCNLRCRFCHLSYFAPPDPSYLTIDNFLEIELLLPHLKTMSLFGVYEPLVCPDFLPIFEKICAYPIETYFSTNGIKLTPDIVDSIVGRLRYLTVSITGFTPDSYKKNMGVRQFDTVKNNLRNLSQKKKERGTEYPALRISMVAMQDTLEELRLALDFVKEFEVAEGLQVTSFKALSEDLVAEMPLADMDRYRRHTDDALAYADKIGVKCVLQSGDVNSNERDSVDLGHKLCGLPWYRLSLRANGDVFPCPSSYVPIGNFFETPITEIWEGTVLDQFRTGVNDLENMNTDCRNCTHCKHRSLTNRAMNDFSKAQNYIAGMTRI